MHIRVEVPLIENKESSRIINGYKIYFNKKTMKRLLYYVKTETHDLYEWNIICVDDKECNVLIGKNFKK